MASGSAEGPKPDQYANPLAPTPEQLALLPHDNAGPKLNAVVWSLTALSGFVLGLRIYCRAIRRKGLWWDDGFLIAAWICITVESALLTYMTGLGYGKHIWDFNVLENMPRLLIPINAAGTFSVTSAIWSKTSFGITLLHLTDGWTKKVTWFIIITMNIAMGLSALFPWVNCTPFIWGLQMKKKEKIGVGIAMSMGIVAGVTGLVKVSQIPKMLSTDFADGVDLWLWGNAETTVTIIAASIPMLRVMIRDAAGSRRTYGSSDYYKEGGLSSGKRSMRVVTISSGPMASDVEMAKQSNDDDSDKGILVDGYGESMRMGRIVQTNDFQINPAPPMAAPDSGPLSQQTFMLPSSPLSQDDPELLRESERYLRTGVAPPSKADNRSRFKSFIARINRRQWELLSDGVQARVAYNKHDLSLYEFTQLLKQEFPPKINITMDIITSVGGDATVDGPVGARLRVKTLAIDGPCLPSAARQHFEHARHMFVYFTDNKISQIYDFSDTGEKQSLAQTIVPPPSLRPPPPRTSIDMRQFYADYIACINNGRMTEELDQFCRPSGVVWNGTHMAVHQYSEMIQGSLDAISGLFFDIHSLVVDEGRQQLAARIEFTGTPVKPFAGGVPNGRPVAFSEHVFYWLEQGKISHVLSIVDWEEYRTQLAR
ncbi:hypothetical protein C8A01DRAFT_14465 [Parachaetomium inaequale]|uniref:Rhodopsin domain-containing protein n=1 Tax=Parachaetomium inaequale TaxID=2588326 RepID=A0AAN6STM4_9PEZI|nr:hypothetical protein C8A01DRAFT_14465 [Parachaetomium inaequale]